MVGFRTTKTCQSATNIRSIQILYISTSEDVCSKYLSPISDEMGTQTECPPDEEIYSVDNIKKITGWTSEELRRGGRHPVQETKTEMDSISIGNWIVLIAVIGIIFVLIALIFARYWQGRTL